MSNYERYGNFALSDCHGNGQFRRDFRNCMPTYEQANRYYNFIDIPVASNRSNNASPIHTNGPEETDRFLRKLPHEVYGDITPKINELAITAPSTTESAVTMERQVSLRCLQPPPPEPPGPHIIDQVYGDPQPVPPIRLVETPQPRSQSPLIFRERPPTPPRPASPTYETQVVPNPERAQPSIIIDRFEAPIKPRDIIIERWLPYGSAPPRRTIINRTVHSKTPPPRPEIILNIHHAPLVHIVSQFKCLGVTPEDPADYISRHGPSLLEPHILVELVRREGVTEDITCPCSSLPKKPCNCGCSNAENKIRRCCYCIIHGAYCPRMRPGTGTQLFDVGNGEIRSDFVVN